MLENLLCMNLHTAGMVTGSVGTVVSLGAFNYLSRLALQDYNYGVWLVLTVLFYFSSIMLIVGTMQNKDLLLLPWLFIAGFSIITFALVAFPFYFKLMKSKTLLVQMMYSVLIGIILVLKMYVYYGICSLDYRIRKIRAKGHSKALK